MRTTVLCQEPSKISDIVDFVHDHWLDIGRVTLDSETKTLTIPYLRPRGHESHFFLRPRYPMLEGFLKIYYVEKYVVRDTERVRLYDINELIYDPRARVLRITTGVPLEFVVRVTAFKVSAEETEALVQG